MKRLKTQKGITLVALIITIVVLLILAAVAIGAVKNSDIIGYAQNATVGYETEKGKENEAIKDAEDLLSQYANGENNGNLDAVTLLAKFTENPEAFKHPEQSSTNNDRAIGTDGTAVNMDWWRYTVIDESNKEIALSVMDGSATFYAYYGEIKDGSIVGSVPQYIKREGSNEIYTVTNMASCFASNKELEVAPKIPDTVTYMRHMFEYCDNLRIAPEIPYGVTDMGGAFQYCTNLITTPIIPGSVTNMNGTFRATNLTTAPIIPNSVTMMNGTFVECTKLEGILKIEAANISEIYVTSCINGTRINKIQVPANSVTESSVRAVYGSDTNITIETF